MTLAQANQADPKLQGTFLLLMILLLAGLGLLALLVAMRAWRRYFLMRRETRARSAALDGPDPWKVSGRRLTQKLAAHPDGPDETPPDENNDEPRHDPTNN